MLHGPPCAEREDLLEWCEESEFRREDVAEDFRRKLDDLENRAAKCGGGTCTVSLSEDIMRS